MEGEGEADKEAEGRVKVKVRDHLHRALNHSAKEGGRAAKRGVWKASLLAVDIVEPRLEKGKRWKRKGEEAERTLCAETSLCTSLKGGRRASG